MAEIPAERLTLERKLTQKQELARRRWIEKGEYIKTPLIDTKQIVAYGHDLDGFLNQIFLAMEDGYMYYSFIPQHVAVHTGPLISCTMAKLDFLQPQEPKEPNPEVAEIQEKFADQQGAAAKQFQEPVKRGRKAKT